MYPLLAAVVQIRVDKKLLSLGRECKRNQFPCQWNNWLFSRTTKPDGLYFNIDKRIAVPSRSFVTMIHYSRIL